MYIDLPFSINSAASGDRCCALTRRVCRLQDPNYVDNRRFGGLLSGIDCGDQRGAWIPALQRRILPRANPSAADFSEARTPWSRCVDRRL